MEVPRHWRNKGFMLNPLKNGFRPGQIDSIHNKTVNEFVSEKAAQITSSSCGIENQEVKAHSKMINEEPELPVANSSEAIPIDVQVLNGLIYQEA